MPAYAPRPRQRVSPQSLALVVGIHAAALGALWMAKPALVAISDRGPIQTELLPLDPVPPPIEPEVEPRPDPAPPAPRQPDQLTQSDPLVPIPLPGPSTPSFIDDVVLIDPVPAPPLPSLPGNGNGGSGAQPAIAATSARLLTSGADLQPPYPSAKQRTGEEAVIRLRLSIDAEGRVTAVAPVGSVDRAFLRSADRHIRQVWRYAPATQGGEPVATSIVVRLRFVLR